MILLRIYGIVQGVGFRPFIWRLAKSYDLKGYVKNKGGYVEVALEGNISNIDNFQKDLETQLPEQAHIDFIDRVKEIDRNFKDFSIAPSEETSFKALSGIPPDIATCDACKRELFDPNDRRHLYPFINCTDCGPRFTIISNVPYDRAKTSMSEYPMCQSCEVEYNDPRDRRYHAEPLACPIKGPNYSLIVNEGLIEKDPIKRAARLLDNGEVVAIKGLGGFHIACDATKASVIKSLRSTLGRENQPFAIMVRDLECLEGELEVSEDEKRNLMSPASPIVVLKRNSYDILPDAVAPGLVTVGILLPYAPIHHILFSYLRTPCVVMTSANYPGNPMITSLTDAQVNLPSLDNFLTHNLTINNRCDDSVIRDDKFIRRSRGYVPRPLECPSKSTMLAFGAELNNVFAITKSGKCILSQHIGDTSNWDVMEAAIDALDNLMRICDVKKRSLDAILCDLHPKFNTSIVAQEWANALSLECIRVQHHIAHSFAIAWEYGYDDIICIAADGVGYGGDGNSWGGEVFFTNRRIEDTKRIGHLEYLKMPGGDLATKYPLRMLIPLFENEALRPYAKYFTGGLEEMDAIRKITLSSSHLTSSCGRVLDSVSGMLELSVARTYEGEGPMRLESLAFKGEDLGIPLEVEDGIAMTSEFLVKAFEMLKGHSKKDIAKSVHMSLANAFIQIVEEHRDLCLPVGFSGGVAYNAIISKALRKGVENIGVEFLEHRKVPPGDGGISFGQTCISL